MTAGTIAIDRVRKRRSTGRILKRRNPSITICPARVPVSVELCPAEINATAKSTLATVVPRSGARSPWACWISVTTRPFL